MDNQDNKLKAASGLAIRNYRKFLAFFNNQICPTCKAAYINHYTMHSENPTPPDLCAKCKSKLNKNIVHG